MFDPGALSVVHGLAVLEMGPARVGLPTDLLDHAQGMSIAYMSLNDLLNLIVQLRSVPDLIAYLDARAGLPASLRFAIGGEQQLCTYYMLKGESFAGCTGPGHLHAVVEKDPEELTRRFRRKLILDRFSSLVERVADALATRNPDYAVGLDAETLSGFDQGEQRSNYLLLQDNLCDLRLKDRRSLGHALSWVMSIMEQQTEGVVFQALYTDAKPDFLYLLMSARRMDRPNLLRAARAALLDGLAHYRKQRGMAIVDRDGAGFEVVLVEPPRLDPGHVGPTSGVFAHLKMTHAKTPELLPEP